MWDRQTRVEKPSPGCNLSLARCLGAGPLEDSGLHPHPRALQNRGSHGTRQQKYFPSISPELNGCDWLSACSKSKHATAREAIKRDTQTKILHARTQRDRQTALNRERKRKRGRWNTYTDDPTRALYPTPLLSADADPLARR